MTRAPLVVAVAAATVAAMGVAQPTPPAASAGAALSTPPATPAGTALPSATAASADATFPLGAGRDTFMRICSGCHSPAVAAQQRLDPAGWAGIVEQMASNGAQGTDADFAAITAYLAASFPAKAPAAR